MSLEQQQELESQYVMHTFARKPVELVSGKGMEVEDAEGNTYLDFIAGIGVCSLGHCHPAITKALQDQSERLIHVSNYYYIEGRGELSRKISGLLNGGDPASPEPWQTFYANSGAEANECAIKLARLYARKNAEEAARAAGALRAPSWSLIAASMDERSQRLLPLLSPRSRRRSSPCPVVS